MKKLICILLSALMLLSLCACGTSGESGSGETTGTASGGQMLVGYGRTNITPDVSVPLAGYGNTSQRMSDGFTGYLYATCFAVTDENDNIRAVVSGDIQLEALLKRARSLQQDARQNVPDEV